MPEPNWANRTLWTGDNLDILRGMNAESVDLIYLDPPFNSNKDYAAPVGSKAAGAAFKDTWHLSDLDVAWMGLIADEQPAVAYLLDAAGRTHSKGMQSYLTMMAVRLLEMRRVLKDTGSIYLHCDATASHYLKALMDAIFGPGSFRSDIGWKRTSAHSDTKQGRRQHGRINDVLLYYTAGVRGGAWTWNPIYTDYDADYVSNFYRHEEEGTGRLYRRDNLTAARPGGDTEYEWRVKRPTDGEWEADLDNEWLRGRSGWEYNGALPTRVGIGPTRRKGCGSSPPVDGWSMPSPACPTTSAILTKCRACRYRICG